MLSLGCHVSFSLRVAPSVRPEGRDPMLLLLVMLRFRRRAWRPDLETGNRLQVAKREARQRAAGGRT